jgi:murein DD-endopeptidase MepM/ murein hydrolase activator NlpD
MTLSKILPFFLIFFTIPLILNNQGIFAQENTSKGLSLAKIIKKPSFGWPVDCKIGENCWIYNYVDRGIDDDKGTDLACNSRTYEGHKGTDIALLNAKEIDKNIPVLAAAEGTVLKIRDGEPDRIANEKEIESVKEKRKECGNAVLLDHGEGLKTIYCHLKKGSISVKRGQEIKEGGKIASVGLSGLTEFPHLHFGIIDNGKVIDPFTGLSNDQLCSKTGKPLWNDKVKATYEPIIINQTGFSDRIPTLSALDTGRLLPSKTLSRHAKRFVFWFNYYGAIKGDMIKITILDPNLKEFTTRDILQPKDRARQFYYTGKRITESDELQPGAYSATLTITRENEDGTAQNWVKKENIVVLAQ